MLMRPQDSETEMETSVVKCIKEQMLVKHTKL